MVYLTPYNFEDEILESDVPCLIKFSNRGCPLCLGMEDVYQALYSKYGSRIKFGTVDTEVNPDLSEVFDIDGVPTIFFFDQGDAEEVPYPEDPHPYSGYGQQYLINYLNNKIKEE